jgi:hypothetical protein
VIRRLPSKEDENQFSWPWARSWLREMKFNTVMPSKFSQAEFRYLKKGKADISCPLNMSTLNNLERAMRALSLRHTPEVLASKVPYRSLDIIITP